MQNRWMGVAIATLLWTLFGMVLIAGGAYTLLGYSQTSAIAIGAAMGAVIGLMVGLIAVSPVVAPRHVGLVLRRVVVGSMVGAVLGIGIMLWWGDFPKRTQADLSLIWLGPASLVMGTGIGVLGAIALNRYRHSRLR